MPKLKIYNFTKVIRFLMLCLCLYPGKALYGDTVETTEGSGLYVSSDPTGAEILIDGILRGRTPLNLPGLAPGRYAIRLRHEGYEERRFTVTVSEGGQTSVNVFMERASGRVWIRPLPGPGSPPESALPFDPIIIVDGAVRSDRALILREGFHNLTVRAFGWEDHTETIFVSRKRFQEIDVTLFPASFRLGDFRTRQQRFNPVNTGALGTSVLQFTVTAPGRGSLSITNEAGEEVYRMDLDSFRSRDQSVPWNGRDGNGAPLPDGPYTVRLEASSEPWDGSAPVFQSSDIRVEIDSSLKINLLSMSSSLSGLLFSPAPGTLPQYSFQVEGGLLYDFSSWNSLPMSLNFRMSVIPGLEIRMGVDFSPGDETLLAIGGALKWKFLDKPLRIAAAVGYGWSPVGEIDSYSQVSGIVLALPLALDLGDWSLILSPGAAFPGIDGKPARALGVLSGGVIYSGSIVMAGISAEAALDFSSLELDHVFAGAEFRVFPFGSYFYLTLLGGYRQIRAESGGFCGVGLGIVN